MSEHRESSDAADEAVGATPDDDVRPEYESSWVELFPFVLMAVVLIATIVSLFVSGEP